MRKGIDNFMFLRESNTCFTLHESIKFREFLQGSSTKLQKFLNNWCSKFAKNSITQDKFRRMTITGDLPQIKELLEPDCVQTFILAGEEGNKILLLPLLAEFFSNSVVASKEKEAKVKQLRNDFSEAKRIANEEFDERLKNINLQGIKYFDENVNEAIKPYKL